MCIRPEYVLINKFKRQTIEASIIGVLFYQLQQNQVIQSVLRCLMLSFDFVSAYLEKVTWPWLEFGVWVMIFSTPDVLKSIDPAMVIRAENQYSLFQGKTDG